MSSSPLSIPKNRWIFAGCWFIWTLVHFFMLTDWGFSWQLSVQDSVISNALLAGACVVVGNILRFYRPARHSYLYVVVICIAVSGLWGGIIKFGLGSLLKYDKDYVAFLDRSLSIRFDIAFLITGCAAMISLLWYNVQEQKQNEQRKADAEKLAKEAELYRLQQQIQPHFLFNSLNSISALAGTQPEQARKMIQQLSDFFRGTLKREEHQWVTLQQELENLELYLDIEKVRFSHRLHTEIISDERSRQLQIPPLLLQPIVENSIKFGLYDTTESIMIRIEAIASENYLLIYVQNPFDPLTSRSQKGTGFGLSSIQRRLYLLFARNDLLTTTAEANLFTTTVRIPQPA